MVDESGPEPDRGKTELGNMPTWLTEASQRVGVNIATAGILFALALVFKSQIFGLFSPALIEEYPIVCTLEPFPGGQAGQMLVDFYFLNREGELYDDPKLRTRLGNFNPNQDRALSPAIMLEIRQGSPARFADASDDRRFNDDKGVLDTDISSDGRSVTLRIKRIEKRSLLRARLTLEGLNFVDPELSPAATTRIPFDFERYQMACYSG
jgi:hypothetical protein